MIILGQINFSELEEQREFGNKLNKIAKNNELLQVFGKKTKEQIAAMSKEEYRKALETVRSGIKHEQKIIHNGLSPIEKLNRRINFKNPSQSLETKKGNMSDSFYLDRYGIGTSPAKEVEVARISAGSKARGDLYNEIKALREKYQKAHPDLNFKKI